MSAIGPDLPPHLLAKRKRREQDDEQAVSSTTSGAKTEPGLESSDKRRRVVGPAMPPAPLDERPNNPSELNDSGSEDDDDEEYGPSMPSTGQGKTDGDEDGRTVQGASETTTNTTAESKPQRDEWMTMAPAQDDLAARMDPSRIRARGFNTGRSAREAKQSNEPSSWHETAEEKKRRLANEVLGIQEKAPSSKSHVAHSEVERTKMLAREHKSSNRGPSLMEQHREREPEQVEDDISKRTFDREKDMGSGLSGANKREMLNRASDYSSRFTGGSYL